MARRPVEYDQKEETEAQGVITQGVTQGIIQDNTKKKGKRELKE